MSKYYYLLVTFKKHNDDADKVLQASYDQFKCDGVEEFSMDEPAVDELLGEKSYSGGDLPDSVLNDVDRHMSDQKDNKIKYYFSESDAKQRAQAFHLYLKENYSHHDIELIEEEVKDWNEEWRKHFKTIDVSKRLKVIPSWEESPVKCEFPIILYPGMGFGTGSHETTFLCLKFLDEIEGSINKARCMDYGCGSSILGIAAMKMGFKKVDLYDIDENAMVNSKQNIELNFKGDQNFSLYLPKDKSKFEKSYDLVFANILAHILLDIAEELFSLTARGGKLVLSGILKEQVTDVEEKYQSIGFKHIKTEFKNDWCAVLLEKL